MRQRGHPKGRTPSRCIAASTSRRRLRDLAFAPWPPAVLQWGIFESDPLSTWWRSRVVLLGDACHPTTPYMASGAAMALGDAVVLARCFAQRADASLEQVFDVYEAIQKPRASQVQAGSSANTWMRNATHPDSPYGYDASAAPLAAAVAA